MSQTILSSTSPSPPPVDLVPNVTGRQRSPSPIDSGIAVVEPVTVNEHPEPQLQYLNKIGASFPQNVISGSENSVLEFTGSQLDEILTLVSWQHSMKPFFMIMFTINIEIINPLMVAVWLMLHSIGLGNSYFPTRISESEVRGARRIPTFPLGNTTFPTSIERYFLLGNSYLHSFRAR